MRGESFMVTLAAQLAARIAQAQAKGWLQKTDWSKPLRGIAGRVASPSPRPGVWRPRKALNTITPRRTRIMPSSLPVSSWRWRKCAMIWRAWHCAFASYSQDSVAIFDIYLHLLNDPGYIKPIPQQGQQEHWTAISAVKLISDRLIEQFKGMKDPYLRERSTDVKDIAQRLISRLVRTNRAAHHRRTRGAGRR